MTRVDIRHTATTIDVIHLHVRRRYGQYDTSFSTYRVIIGHAALVAATIEVTDLALLQMPSRADRHIDLVVTAKDTTKLIVAATRLYARLYLHGINAHPLQALRSHDIWQIIVCCHFAGVIDTDQGGLIDGSLVTAAKDMGHRAAMKIQVSLVDIRHFKVFVRAGNLITSLAILDDMYTSLICIQIISIAAAIRLSNKDMKARVFPLRGAKHKGVIGFQGILILMLVRIHTLRNSDRY